LSLSLSLSLSPSLPPSLPCFLSSHFSSLLPPSLSFTHIISKMRSELNVFNDVNLREYSHQQEDSVEHQEVYTVWTGHLEAGQRHDDQRGDKRQTQTPGQTISSRDTCSCGQKGY
ncbi:hypothetical protein EGW08_016817, partial [Elysia chlorotica]